MHGEKLYERRDGEIILIVITAPDSLRRKYFLENVFWTPFIPWPDETLSILYWVLDCKFVLPYSTNCAFLDFVGAFFRSPKHYFGLTALYLIFFGLRIGSHETTSIPDALSGSIWSLNTYDVQNLCSSKNPIPAQNIANELNVFFGYAGRFR